MGLGDKTRHTGIVRQQTWNKGTKSEHTAVVLDTGTGPAMNLRIRGGNPFHDPALDAFIGKRVSVEGVEGSGLPFLMVDSVADIKVLGPPGRPRRPPSP